MKHKENEIQSNNYYIAGSIVIAVCNYSNCDMISPLSLEGLYLPVLALIYKMHRYWEINSLCCHLGVNMHFLLAKPTVTSNLVFLQR